MYGDCAFHFLHGFCDVLTFPSLQVGICPLTGKTYARTNRWVFHHSFREHIRQQKNKTNNNKCSGLCLNLVLSFICTALQKTSSKCKPTCWIKNNCSENTWIHFYSFIQPASWCKMHRQTFSSRFHLRTQSVPPLDMTTHTDLAFITKYINFTCISFFIITWINCIVF